MKALLTSATVALLSSYQGEEQRTISLSRIEERAQRAGRETRKRRSKANTAEAVIDKLAALPRIHFTG
jgi:hypothetical protein